MIPARLGSERLPEKPLRPILGRPLLEWVWERVSGFSVFDELVVATDHERVVDLCNRIGAPVVLTRDDHPSGTDRVAEVARSEVGLAFDIFVNLQGDEPLMEGAHVERAVSLVRDAGWEVGTCATPVSSVAAFHDPSAVKVVCGMGGRALYFSRSPIPHVRGREPDSGDLTAPPFLRHVGLYAYSRDALLRWVSLPPSPLETLERLEQLRALEAGISIGVTVVSEAAPGVDTPDDVLRMARLLQDAQQPTETSHKHPSTPPIPSAPVEHGNS